MEKFTQGPWKLFRNDQSVGDARGYAVCDVWPRGDDGMASEEGKANARRIVACVNACRGLPTDELEQKGLVAAVGTELLELDQLRNELLAALEHLHHNAKASGAEMGLALDVAEEAIAKAKSGAA
ncbi:hypothetical protein [Aeromonas hydrophila]|uniref:hypothetical protein n=1 Tax=Aeromonas hydrophila TaxID=644 RepID=UPI002360D547|nr:hypothetical protein [Aeromonas hydrophila]